MAVRKLKLDGDSPEEITLVGLSSALKDYRLIHYLNKGLRINFVRIPNLPYYITNTRMLSVPLYYYTHHISEKNWFIFSNRSYSNEFVLPQYKTLDFFLLIDDMPEQDATGGILRQLRNVKGIDLATNVDTNKVKKIDLLYADLEMHLMEIYSDRTGESGLGRRI